MTVKIGSGNPYNDNFLIKVQKGEIPGHSIISKFAENPNILAASAREDIWDYPAQLLYTYSATADIDTISSDNGADNQLIVIQGLDANYLEVTQVKNLDGLNKVVLDTPLLRVYRAFNGNGTPTLGNVYVYPDTPINLGIPTDTTKVRAYISIVEQQTLMGVYTVPAGKTGYFLGFSASMSKETSTSSAIISGSARPFGAVFRTQIRFSLKSSGSSYVNVPSNGFSAFPEKTDFVAYTNVSANSTGISITFDILLVDN